MSTSKFMRRGAGVLLCCYMAGAPALVHAQKKEQSNKPSATASKNDCANPEQKKFNVKCKPRYFLGEAPAITISITNTSRAPQTLKAADYQKFSFEATGVFDNDAGKFNKTGVYDGSWDFPKATPSPAPGETSEWLAPRKREPKFVKLAPGESTELVLDLSKVFSAHLGIGKYELIVKSEDGQRAVKEFEVYFDDDKSFPLLSKAVSEDSDEREWAVVNLAKFSRTKFVALLEALAKSGNEKQRVFASGMLAQTKAGWFDYLKLRVEIKDRYFVGEKPILAISIVNGSSTEQTVTEAEFQKFYLELTRLSGGDSKQQTETCAYDGKQGRPADQRANEKLRKPRIVKLAELESTTLSLDLTECFHSKLSVGKYQLTVKSAEAQNAFQEQKVVKTFEIYSDAKKSARALVQR